MPYSAKAVANFFIDTAIKGEKLDISPMKLQKLVYFSHAWYLGYYNEPLVTNEIQAWKYGPVIPSLYHAIKNYGTDNITQKLEDVIFTKNGTVEPITPNILQEDEKALGILNAVWRNYGHLDPIQLSNMTHEQTEPWYQVIQSAGHFVNDLQIPNELIAKIYHQKIESDNA